MFCFPDSLGWQCHPLSPGRQRPCPQDHGWQHPGPLKLRKWPPSLKLRWRQACTLGLCVLGCSRSGCTKDRWIAFGSFFPFLLKTTHVCSQVDLSSCPVYPRSPTAFFKFVSSLSSLVKQASSVSVSIIPSLLLASAEMADFRFSFVFIVSLSNDFPTASLVLSQEHAFLFFCNMNRLRRFQIFKLWFLFA